MHVFSRRKNERVVINGDITLTVIDIRGDKVRLGVVCPRHVPIHRQEAYEAIYGRPPGGPWGRSEEETALLRAILDSPNDEAIRLVYADWLEERCDPLATLLRAGNRAARLPAGDPQRGDLRRQERALWAEHGPTWAAFLPPALWPGAAD